MTGVQAQSPGADAAPYQQLVKMIERELELAGQGRTAELQAAVRASGEQLQALASPTTPQTLALIHRARALRGRVIIETRRVQESIARSRSSLHQARRMARTYAPYPDRRYTTSA